MTQQQSIPIKSILESHFQKVNYKSNSVQEKINQIQVHRLNKQKEETKRKNRQCKQDVFACIKKITR